MAMLKSVHMRSISRENSVFLQYSYRWPLTVRVKFSSRLPQDYAPWRDQQRMMSHNTSLEVSESVAAMSASGEEKSAFNKLMDGVSGWVQRNNDPRFREFKQQQIGQIFGFQDEANGAASQQELEFKWGDHGDAEHDLIVRLIHLHTSVEILSQTQYYFRRFPFRGRLPITRADHSRNLCEFYFAQFYVIRNRLKATMNSLKVACPHTTINIGRVLKVFDKEFDSELRERNALTHHRPFDDVGLSLVTITGLVAGSMTNPAIWNHRHQSASRTFAREWSKRAKRRSMAAKNFMEAVTQIILRDAHFLNVGPSG